jgi:hypothetical protein
VNSVGSVHKCAWCAGGIQRGHNLLGYDCAFANAAYHQSSFAGMDGIDGFYKIAVDEMRSWLTDSASEAMVRIAISFMVAGFMQAQI